MSEKEYIVVVKRGIDLNEIDAEMQSSSGNDVIPQRAVDVANARVGSKRMTHYALTDEEATQLSNDPRVLSVEIPVEQREDIVIDLNARRFNNYDKPATISSMPAAGNFVNWGLIRSNQITNEYTGTNNNNSSTDYFNYVLDGTGVDVVIQDSGIDPDHPEWEDANGNSRLQQIDWYTASGLSGTQNANHYRDYDGHGTHVASTAVGKEFGWAKNAQIYSQKLNGLEGSGDSGTGISITNAFDTIRLWHNAKTNGRPTVVNMSWGTSLPFQGSSRYTGLGGNYRGTGWNFGVDYTTESALVSATGFNPAWTLYGSDGGSAQRIPVRASQYDAEVEDMIDDGIHICIASGNQMHKIDIVGGLDYDNTFTYGGSTYYYHRGSSPYTDEAFMVGNLAGGETFYSGSPVANTDVPSITSNYGPGCNIWAPGQHICAANSSDSSRSDQPYYFNNSYRQMSIGGTSMASPQVAGVCALFLQAYPNLTPAQLQKMIFDYSKPTVNFTQTGSTDYDVYPTGTYLNFSPSSCGGPNRHLFNPYNKSTPVSAIGSGTITGMKLVV